MTGGAKESLVRENDRQWTLSNRVEAEGLEWLYADPSANKQREGNLEEYLLGKSIEGARGELARDPIDHAAAGSLLADTADGKPLDDTLNKFREDPLFIIKKIELHQRQVMKKYESLVNTGVKPMPAAHTGAYVSERSTERHSRRRGYESDGSSGRDYSTSPRRRDRSRGRAHRAEKSHRRERSTRRSESLRRHRRGRSGSRDYRSHKRDRTRSSSREYRYRHRSGRRSPSISDSEERYRRRISRHSDDSGSSGSHSGRGSRSTERRHHDRRYRDVSRGRVRRHSRNSSMDRSGESDAYERHRRRSRSLSEETYRRKQHISDERRPRDGTGHGSTARRSPSYGHRHHMSASRKHSRPPPRSSKSAESDGPSHRRERHDCSELRKTRDRRSNSSERASDREERERRRATYSDRSRRRRSRSRERSSDGGGRKEHVPPSDMDNPQVTESKEPIKTKRGPVLPRKGDTLRYAFGVTEDIMPPQAIQDRAEQRRKEMEERKRLQQDLYAPQNQDERLTEMQSHGMSHLKERLEKMAEHERSVQSEEVEAPGSKGDYISLMKHHAFESAKKEERIRQRASRSLVEDE
ncbi:pre-mRNA splicing protein, putative [Babesia ovata]|uniref:Pre-mRNA splicing protein, putative n=1 Tax=Babesia ovata TaxID=189622 RepID=A0A2H6KGX6_9APIC|nr:pre-mRNA splicing protein, putative [Babesia ovata]GBE62242.1 pre-mRNA splicing protein, putative [Babesia ovata]